MLHNFVHEKDRDQLREQGEQGDDDDDDDDNNNNNLLQFVCYLVADAVQFSTMAFLFSHMYAPCPLTMG